MNLLVTGAGGFIAKNFINYSKKKFKNYSNFKKKRNSKRNLKWIVGQFNKINLSNIDKFDTLIHFASVGIKPKKNNLKKNFKINVLDSRELILNAIKNNCKKFVIIGTSSEFGKNIRKMG